MTVLSTQTSRGRKVSDRVLGRGLLWERDPAAERGGDTRRGPWGLGREPGEAGRRDGGGWVGGVRRWRRNYSVAFPPPPGAGSPYPAVCLPRVRSWAVEAGDSPRAPTTAVSVQLLHSGCPCRRPDLPPGLSQVSALVFGCHLTGFGTGQGQRQAVDL